MAGSALAYFVYIGGNNHLTKADLLGEGSTIESLGNEKIFGKNVEIMVFF